MSVNEDNRAEYMNRLNRWQMAAFNNESAGNSREPYNNRFARYRSAAFNRSELVPNHCTTNTQFEMGQMEEGKGKITDVEVEQLQRLFSAYSIEDENYCKGKARKGVYSTVEVGSRQKRSIPPRFDLEKKKRDLKRLIGKGKKERRHAESTKEKSDRRKPIFYDDSPYGLHYSNGTTH